MKKGFNILLIVCAALMTLSCSKTKSYTDMLKAEEKAIDRLIAQEGIEVLKDFPVDTIFKENQFVKLENGVYMNIIDRGTSQRAVLNKTNILIRFTARHIISDSLTYIAKNNYYIYSNYGPHSNGTTPWEFRYGAYAEANVWFIGEGIQTPLEYVGDNAKVKLIVPFKRGDYYDDRAGEPLYYEILLYKFAENL